MRALTRKLLRDGFHLRMPLLTIALVSALGQAVFLSSLGVASSLQRALDGFYDSHRFADLFVTLKRAPEAAAAPLAALDGVAALETRVVVEASIAVPGMREPAGALIVSLPDRGEPVLNRPYLRRGRWPEPGRDDEALAGESFMTAHGLQPGVVLVARIRGRLRALRVTGVALSPEFVYSLQPGGIFPDDRRFGIFWMARTPLAAAAGMGGAFNDLAVRLAPGASPGALIAALDARLDARGSLGARGRDRQLSHRYVSDEFRQLRTSGTVLPSIFLVASAFLLSVVIGRLVRRQRGQIAALKSFGYTPREIGGHYLAIALLPVAAGALLGLPLALWLGGWMVGLYARYYRFPALAFHAGVNQALFTVALAAAAATVGALASVRAVLKLAPAEALRPEPPAAFRAGLLERAGLLRALGPAGRIVARNLLRRPGRLALSVFTISLAGALLVSSQFTLDAIRHMLDSRFRVADRETLAVALTGPVSRAGAAGLARLPGVVRAEPARAAAVELRAGHRTRRVALAGLRADDALSRLIDRRLRVIPPPPEEAGGPGGLVLTAQLARELGVGPGDRVRVRGLEGRRPEAEMVVRGLADELIGAGAYTAAGDLARFMREAPAANSVRLAVDARRLDALHDRLAGTPAVAATALRESMMRAFERTMEKTMGLFRAVFLGFAALIAASVVYNNARVAFAERAWELASLRVLGFTRAEISAVLLGELGTAVLFAIPAGWAVGTGLAWLTTLAYRGELFRIPLTLTAANFALSATLVLAAALAAALAVRRRLDRLDLVSVLKARE